MYMRIPPMHTACLIISFPKSVGTKEQKQRIQILCPMQKSDGNSNFLPIREISRNEKYAELASRLESVDIHSASNITMRVLKTGIRASRQKVRKLSAAALAADGMISQPGEKP